MTQIHMEHDGIKKLICDIMFIGFEVDEWWCLVHVTEWSC